MTTPNKTAEYMRNNPPPTSPNDLASLGERTQHTPGPWHIGMKPGPMIYGERGEQVADMCAEMMEHGEHVANARLIAAAPELLAALRELLKINAISAVVNIGAALPEPSAAYTKVLAARAAIAKAEAGETNLAPMPG